jgi:Flp pilus assembly protein TadG
MTTHQQLCRNAARRRPHPRVRDGSVTLEFLLVLPVLLIVLLAAVEFGMFFSNMQQVAVASRTGAELASQTVSLPDTGLVPIDITNAISQQLSTSGIAYGAVLLEHNADGDPHLLTTPDPLTSPCNPPATALPTLTYGHYVRITICVPMTELAPNCLARFGFDLTGRSAKSSTTFRYEL